MKKVLFFAAALLLVTACNNANNGRTGDGTVTERPAGGGRYCEEECERDGSCEEHRRGDCEVRDNCSGYHDDNCVREENCDSHHGRHSGCNDDRRRSGHCNDRC